MRRLTIAGSQGADSYLKGRWASNLAYQSGDIVVDGQHAFICSQDSTGFVTSNTSYWQPYITTTAVGDLVTYNGGNNVTAYFDDTSGKSIVQGSLTLDGNRIGGQLSDFDVTDYFYRGDSITVKRTQTLDVDYSRGNQYLLTVDDSLETPTVTLTFSGWDADAACEMRIDVKDGDKGAVSFSGVTWEGGVAPVLGSGVTRIILFTENSGNDIDGVWTGAF